MVHYACQKLYLAVILKITQAEINFLVFTYPNNRFIKKIQSNNNSYHHKMFFYADLLYFIGSELLLK